MKLLEKISIGYLKQEAKLTSGDVDFKRLELIKNTGRLTMLLAIVCAIYLGYLISESWMAGIVIGIGFTLVYINFYLVLLSTIRKSDFIAEKQVLAEERSVIVNNVKLIGDGKKYPDTFLPGRFWFSIVLRFFFLGIFSSFLSIGAVLLLHASFGDKATDLYKEKTIKSYSDFIESSINKRLTVDQSKLNQLSKNKSQLQTIKDSLSALSNSNSENIGLQEELAWAESDLQEFNLSHESEMNQLASQIAEATNQIAAKKSSFVEGLDGKLFFTQRIKYIFSQYTFSAVFVFVLSILFFFLPFIIRYAMVKSAKYSLDDKLQQLTKNIVEEEYAQFLKRINNTIGENGYQGGLQKHFLNQWPLAGDHFENPPFNTIAHLDKRTILRKGSFTLYLKNANT